MSKVKIAKKLLKALENATTHQDKMKAARKLKHVMRAMKKQDNRDAMRAIKNRKMSMMDIATRKRIQERLERRKIIREFNTMVRKSKLEARIAISSAMGAAAYITKHRGKKEGQEMKDEYKYDQMMKKRRTKKKEKKEEKKKNKSPDRQYYPKK